MRAFSFASFVVPACGQCDGGAEEAACAASGGTRRDACTRIRGLRDAGESRPLRQTNDSARVVRALSFVHSGIRFCARWRVREEARLSCRLFHFPCPVVASRSRTVRLRFFPSHPVCCNIGRFVQFSRHACSISSVITSA
ncbi:hypothetical protein A8E16_17670 [Burkholderia cenocepacia]|nr:hypothetical protein A8D86_29565 [Burkholderia cenocepacia]ONP34188.1 hypothetical protein A8D84_04685 [Burkholderia cenocepacia]ONP56078.1 hypothetical protein A8D87_04215 [Burkholderia cenocepacia]ONP59090.1 hypothetical protein A8D89_16300 [Burkholderia cenocepacia]ONP64499.1 hypothetical protein A8D94_32250 [Burkholderia cenocepacia]